MPAGSLDGVPTSGKTRLLAAADDLMTGRWTVFAHPHPAMGAVPDWFVDARSGQRSPATQYAFDIPYRNEAVCGNIKYIWEPSRHHHLTLLAAAFAITHDERYGVRVAEHLRSWWRDNPFLTGPHWLSGIEIGIRLISWVWIRRLLGDWQKAPALFECNPLFLRHLQWHQEFLGAFPSRGSSANNHLLAEAVGLFVSAAAFPCSQTSADVRNAAAEVVERELVRQTFDCGLNRELATDYHALALDLGWVAAIEGTATGRPLASAAWSALRRMTDAAAAMVDGRGRPPRQGDGDDGTALLVDAPDYDRWASLLSTGRTAFGEMPWWPASETADVRTALFRPWLVPPPLEGARPQRRSEHFVDAGQVYLRTHDSGPEVWCRCDHGPHGYLSIAAHAHADALSIEVRVDGVDILADPGTYCYHGDPRWRAYFRGTVGHNTLELLGRDQSVSGGPFLWTRHAGSRLLEVSGLEGGPAARWCAEHDGYTVMGGPVHRRCVTLDRLERRLTILDSVIAEDSGVVPCRLAFHLGPTLKCRLEEDDAWLAWPEGAGRMELPPELTWSLHRGEDDPPLGWYSPRFDIKEPAFTLIGSGQIAVGAALRTVLAVQAKDGPAAG